MRRLSFLSASILAACFFLTAPVLSQSSYVRIRALSYLPGTCSPLNFELIRLTVGDSGLYACMAENVWMRIDNTGLLDVKAFGAKGDGLHDDTTHIQAAINQAKITGDEIFVPPGNYILSSTLDMSGPGQVRLRGSGPWNTVFRTSVTTTAGILIGGSATTRKSMISGICLSRGLPIPGAQVAGNYGIQVPDAGAGDGIAIRDCYVLGFANSAIRIAGPAGPVVIEDVQIDSCAGYGIEIRPGAGGLSPQDTTISRGSIQICWGGVDVGPGANSTSIYDIDIELAGVSRFPAVYLEAASFGTSLTNVTAQLSLIPVAPLLGVVVISGGANTIVGGVNNAVAIVDNLLFLGAGAYDNTIIGGLYQGAGGGGSGWFANFGGAIRTVFVNPELVVASYQAGRDAVNDVAANFVSAFGVRTIAAVGSTHDSNIFAPTHIVGVPALTTDAESWLGPSALTGIYFKAGRFGFGTATPGSFFDLYAATVGGDTVNFKNGNTADSMFVGVANNSNKQLAMISYGDTAAGNLFGVARAGANVILGYNNPTSLMIGTLGNQPVLFGRNNTEFFRIHDVGGGVLAMGIGTPAPAATSIVDMTAIGRGVLLPRMTTAERVAIVAPAEGLIVYDLTLHMLYCFDATIWRAAW